MDIVTNLSEREWETFLSSTPNASIFQSPAMTRVYRETKGYRPHVLAALSGGKTRAVLSGAIVSYSPGRASAVSSRATIAGGPLGDAAAFPGLLGAHDGIAAKAALLTQIRNLDRPADLAPFEASGYRWEDHLNFILDLRSGEGAVLAGMSKARRKGIAQAEQSGLQPRDLGSQDIDSCYSLIRETYARAKIPLADKSLFRAAFEVLLPAGELWALAAVHEGKPCAVRLCLRWGRIVYDWYAGSSNAGRLLHADEWLVWEVLRRAVREGCSAFDFQGAGRPGEPYGPREFKRRFGGTETNPGRFEKVYRPVTLKISKVAYELWRRW